MKEFQTAIGAIMDNVIHKAITEEQAIEQLKGIQVVLDVRSEKCSPNVKEQIKSLKQKIADNTATYKRWQEEGGF